MQIPHCPARRNHFETRKDITLRYSLLAFGALAAAVAVAYGCGSAEEADDSGDAGAAETVQITLKDFSFTPAKLQLETDSQVELKLVNSGSVAHTFTIQEFEIDTEIQPRAETTIQISSGQSGQFNYYCRFHKDQMKGTLTAGDPGESADRSPTPSPADDQPYYDY